DADVHGGPPSDSVRDVSVPGPLGRQTWPPAGRLPLRKGGNNGPVTAGRRPVILVVDADGRARQAMRAGLENAGVDVVEAASAAEAEAVLGEETSGVVLDPRLPDADGLTFAGEVRRRLPGIRVVLYGPGKDDAVAVAAALGLAPEPGRHLAVVELLRGEVGALAEDWRELCRWDPLLPPDSQPP